MELLIITIALAGAAVSHLIQGIVAKITRTQKPVQLSFLFMVITGMAAILLAVINL